MLRWPVMFYLSAQHEPEGTPMHTTVAQNKAHRSDIAWQKSKGKSFTASGERYISEYLNVFTGQAIRKSWRMTGRDWIVFDADGNIVARSATLTLAKYDASEKA